MNENIRVPSISFEIVSIEYILSHIILQYLFTSFDDKFFNIKVVSSQNIILVHLTLLKFTLKYNVE